MKSILDQFPIIIRRKRAPKALTGFIPIEYFNDNEKQLRETVLRYVYERNGDTCSARVMYRGPRPLPFRGSNIPSATRRENATHAVFYITERY